MFPQTLLQAAHNTPVVVEVRSGQTYSGILLNKDNYMNMNLKDVTISPKEEGGEATTAATCFIRGTQVKYVQISNETAQASIDAFAAQGATLHSNLKKTGDDDRKPYNKNNNYNNNNNNNNNERNRDRTYNNNNNTNRGGYQGNNRGGYQGNSQGGNRNNNTTTTNNNNNNRSQQQRQGPPTY